IAHSGSIYIVGFVDPQSARAELLVEGDELVSAFLLVPGDDSLERSPRAEIEISLGIDLWSLGVAPGRIGGDQFRGDDRWAGRRRCFHGLGLLAATTPADKADGGNGHGSLWHRSLPEGDYFTLGP